MLVDPDVLRAFAAQVDTAAATIVGFDVAARGVSATDGLPGSATQWAARQVGRHLGLAASDVVDDIVFLGTAVRGAGDRYEVDDASLAVTFEQLF
ncbi:hypothetical protein AU193_18995 [Mycobacterium sp. GA-1285]|uniref:type VII secretion target n=1 Tax=Mycobacterium sp. GA-1285 TaxID=1772282 RepID=UPI00074ACCCB|nr:type VII secretion target [Mycobacterium sp. GA-1285]KUI11504.1 hypothetical protein AU193_18995 [Mycobacterium sp. GA-1285]